MINAAEIIRTGTGILFVTLDSLRYDVARSAYDDGLTPRLAGIAVVTAPTGTVFEAFGGSELQRLTDRRTLTTLTAAFAVHLEACPDISVIYDGERLVRLRCRPMWRSTRSVPTRRVGPRHLD